MLSLQADHRNDYSPVPLT